MKTMLRVGALFAMLLGSAALAAAGDQPPHPMSGQEAPRFQLPALDGSTVDLADLAGRTVVLHFGTGW